MSPRSGRSVEGDESVSSRRENVSQDTVSSVQYRKGRATRLVPLGEVTAHEARGPALLPRGDRNDHHRGVERPDRLDAQQLEPHLRLHRALERPHDGVRTAAQLPRRGDDSLRFTPELASVRPGEHDFRPAAPARQALELEVLQAEAFPAYRLRFPHVLTSVESDFDLVLGRSLPRQLDHVHLQPGPPLQVLVSRHDQYQSARALDLELAQ